MLPVKSLDKHESLWELRTVLLTLSGGENEAKQTAVTYQRRECIATPTKVDSGERRVELNESRSTRLTDTPTLLFGPGCMMLQHLVS